MLTLTCAVCERRYSTDNVLEGFMPESMRFCSQRCADKAHKMEKP